MVEQIQKSSKQAILKSNPALLLLLLLFVTTINPIINLLGIVGGVIMHNYSKAKWFKPEIK